MAARWSGSKPCFTPSRKTTAVSASAWVGRTSIGARSPRLLADEKLVPELPPLVGLVEDGDGVDHREREVVEVALHLRARGHAPHRLEEPLALGREDEVREEERGVRMGRIAREP